VTCLLPVFDDEECSRESHFVANKCESSFLPEKRGEHDAKDCHFGLFLRISSRWECENFFALSSHSIGCPRKAFSVENISSLFDDDNFLWLSASAKSEWNFLPKWKKTLEEFTRLSLLTHEIEGEIEGLGQGAETSRLLLT
jgi:hypothetical protein